MTVPAMRMPGTARPSDAAANNAASSPAQSRFHTRAAWSKKGRAAPFLWCAEGGVDATAWAKEC